MSSDDHAQRAREYLHSLCDRIDRGEGVSRGHWASKIIPVIAPVALGLSLVSCSANSSSNATNEGILYAGPPPREICDNGVDDDGDGKVDCDDPACANSPGCSEGVLYAGPPADEVCDNGVDDNGDGLVDCDDPTCSDFPECGRIMLYGAPPPQSSIDDDGGNKTVRTPKAGTPPREGDTIVVDTPLIALYAAPPNLW